MIIDAYQHVLRNCEIVAKKPTEAVKTRSDNASANWFEQYGPALNGLWTSKKTA